MVHFEYDEDGALERREIDHKSDVIAVFHITEDSVLPG